MLPQYAKEYILKVEGGYTNHKYDRGGKTNYGITYRDFQKAKNMLHELENIHSVKELTPDLAGLIYERLYWDYYGLDDYEFPVNLVIFDGFVNHNPKDNTKAIQRACNNMIKAFNLKVDLLKVDGVLGPKTKATIQFLSETVNNGAYILANEIILMRAKLYLAITDRRKNQRVFFRGWIRRLIILKNTIMTLMDRFRS